MRGTFAGLGASRAEVEALLMRPAARNEFITHALQKRSKYSYSMTDGKFRWDKEKIYFDFYGQGKLRTITVLWAEIAAGHHLLDDHTFAPWQGSSPLGDRWRAQLTEFAGTAHRRWETTPWERAAWNTVNAWCRPGRYLSGTTAIQQIGQAAQDAWARITEDGAVYYFLPGPEGRISDVRNKYYVARFIRHSPVFNEPSWWNLAPTPEQASYLAVAWDQYVESGGKSFAPLRGLNLKLSKKRR